ncbi:T-complex protein 1 subunit beta-like protein [Tanacetum coccineum]
MLPCVAGVDLKSAKRHQILELEKMWMNFQRELELQNKVIEVVFDQLSRDARKEQQLLMEELGQRKIIKHQRTINGRVHRLPIPMGTMLSTTTAVKVSLLAKQLIYSCVVVVGEDEEGEEGNAGILQWYSIEMDVNFWSIDSWKKREESQVEDATKAAAVSLLAKQLIYRLLHKDPHNRLDSHEGAPELKVIRSVGEGVEGPMNSNLQDDKVGDGTTSMVVWPTKLLREVEKLLAMKIQPLTIIADLF